MKKEEFNSLFREYVKNNLSPTIKERTDASSIYDAIKDALGPNCILIGSFARFTTIRPLHDLYVLYSAGTFSPQSINPKTVLEHVAQTLRNNFKNPTSYTFRLEPQTHSITMVFNDDKKEAFSVDVVPAFVSGLKNEFGDDIYYVPEIVTVGRQKRAALYEELNRTKKNERDWWIKSDPRGYVTSASMLNKKNIDFRKTVKFVKKWKHNCKAKNDNFKLKSFHVEQLITRNFQNENGIEIFDAVYKFFHKLPTFIAHAQIPDRADRDVMIDAYINDLSDAQKKQIVRARDCFLLKLEEFTSSSSIADLLNGDVYDRVGRNEEFLFDYGIPILIEPDANFKIDGYVKPLAGFSAGWLRETPQLQNGLTRGNGKQRYIDFQIISDGARADLYKWKVRNDDACAEPRGEISDHHTRNNPESTAYPGHHYVEAFAIKNNVCVARAKRNVNII